MKYNHAFDFAFEVISGDERAEDVTAAMMIAALRNRISSIEAENGGAEMLEACGLIDTMEED